MPDLRKALLNSNINLPSCQMPCLLLYVGEKHVLQCSLLVPWVLLLL